MVSRRKEVIGLVITESRSPDTDVEQEGLLFLEEVLRGVESALSQVGWSVLISVLRRAERADAFRWLQKISAKVAGYPGVRLDGCFTGRFAAISGQLAVREILATRRELPDAIVCGNDQMAIGAMRELRTAGLRVPADVAVAGFDDMLLGALVAPPLTTVRQPMRLLGERACSCLLDRIADPARPRRVERLPTELIVRESCGCPPGAG